jgi:hypothetical protein
MAAASWRPASERSATAVIRTHNALADSGGSSKTEVIRDGIVAPS